MLAFLTFTRKFNYERQWRQHHYMKTTGTTHTASTTPAYVASMKVVCINQLCTTT